MAKKKKPAEDAQASTSTVSNNADTSPDNVPSDIPSPQAARRPKSESETSSLLTDTPAHARWSGGSWRGKASAVAEVVHDSIAVRGNPSSDLQEASVRYPETPSQRLSRNLKAPSKVNVTKQGSPLVTAVEAKEDVKSRTNAELFKSDSPAADERSTVEQEQSTSSKRETLDEILADRPLPAPGWRGWWAKPSVEVQASHGPGDAAVRKDVPTNSKKDITETSAKSNPEAVIKVQSSLLLDPAQTGPTPQIPAITPPLIEPTAESSTQQPTTSWFSLWGASQKPSVTPSAATAESLNDSNSRLAKAAGVTSMSTVEATKQNTQTSSLASASAPVSSKAASVQPSDSNTSATTKHRAKDVGAKVESIAHPPHPSLVLPPFGHTYRLAPQQPSYVQQVMQMLGPRTSTQAHPKHLHVSPAPHKIRNALAIGVHGYFPSPLIQKVLGQPTGTSTRFANGAAAAIEQWTSAHGYSCRIDKVALEGEGVIVDRVDALWKLLLNHIDQIRKANFIMLASHSQGVPVSVMLVAKLLNFGCINPLARIGICAMAGVNLGPFAYYTNRLFGASATELFTFADPKSPVSIQYQAALSQILQHHVRILYVGAIDDQLVSLESATFANVSHPYIYRAVFVDGRIHAPDFITHLVGFALKLRNLGVSDHGLIRELSDPLAGSLYTSGGHSRIYEEQAVYQLALQHALETSTLTAAEAIPLETKDYVLPSAANANPYFLPWAMRGVLEEEYVKLEMKDETKELLKQFESWKPSSKVLKDVKFRLEAVKSMLL